jgi:hypothetical protein
MRGQQDNNRNAPEQLSLFGELQRLSVSGDCERCTATVIKPEGLVGGEQSPQALV